MLKSTVKTSVRLVKVNNILLDKSLLKVTNIDTKTTLPNVVLVSWWPVRPQRL